MRSPRGASPRPRRCSPPPARPASAPAAPDLAYGGWANAALHRLGRRRHTSARSSYAQRGAVSARRRSPTHRLPHGRPASPTRSRGSAAIDEARAANDRQAELAARLASPRARGCSPSTTAACSRCSRATTSAPANCSGARSRATRRCSAPRRGCGAPRRSRGSAGPSEADAEIRAADARAGPRRAPPGRARRPDGVRAGAQRAGAAATARWPSGGCARPRRHWRRLAGEDDAVARAPGLARRPRAPAGHRRRRARPPSSSASPRSCEDLEAPCPRSMTRTTTTAPVQEVWKVLYDPLRFAEWWRASARHAASAGDGDVTMYPDGLPRLPDAPALRNPHRRSPRRGVVPVSRSRLRLAARTARPRHPHQRPRRDTRGEPRGWRRSTR